MLRKLGEHLLKRGASHSKISILVSMLTFSQNLEHLGKATDFRRVHILLNLIGNLVTSLTLFSQEWQILGNVGIRVSFVEILNPNGVPLSISGFQISWTSIANKSTVDHDDDFVAKRLGLIHSMSCKDH